MTEREEKIKIKNKIKANSEECQGSRSSQILYLGLEQESDDQIGMETGLSRGPRTQRLQVGTQDKQREVGRRTHAPKSRAKQGKAM